MKLEQKINSIYFHSTKKHLFLPSGILEDLKFPAISYFRYFLLDSLHKINKVGYKRDHALKIYKLGRQNLKKSDINISKVASGDNGG